MNYSKKGLSDVVTTVLIILLVLGAIVLLWQFLKPTLDKSGQQITAQSECLQVDLEPVTCNAATDAVLIKTNKKGAANGVRVIITNPTTGASTAVVNSTAIGGELATSTQTAAAAAGDIITVAPIVLINGQMENCAEVTATKITCA